MTEQIQLNLMHEIEVCVEDLSLRLLLDRANARDGETPMPILHNHVSNELFVCVAGEMTLLTERGELLLRQGDAVMVLPGVRHCLCPIPTDAEGGAVSFVCRQRKNGRGSGFYKRFLPFVSDTDVIVWHECPDICHMVLSLVTNVGKTDSILPALQMVEVLLRLVEMPSSSLMPHETGKPQKMYDIGRMMSLDYIVGNFYMKNLSAAHVAELLYISTRQLDRLVKQRYGKTLHAVLMDKRIAAAERLMLTTDETVEYIGIMVGFSSRAGFYREFVRRYGVTPAEYRRQISNK